MPCASVVVIAVVLSGLVSVMVTPSTGSPSVVVTMPEIMKPWPCPMTFEPPANETTHPSSFALGSSWNAPAVVGKSFNPDEIEGPLQVSCPWKQQKPQSDPVQPPTTGLPPASRPIASPSSCRLPPRNDE